MAFIRAQKNIIRDSKRGRTVLHQKPPEMKEANSTTEPASLTRCKDTQIKTTSKPDAVKRLEILATEIKKLKFPHASNEYWKAKNYRDDTDDGLISCILDFLRFSGYQAEEIKGIGEPVTRSFFKGQKCEFISIGWLQDPEATKMANITATINGRVFFIKADTSDSIQSQLNKNTDCVARNFQDFLTFFNFIPRLC